MTRFEFQQRLGLTETQGRDMLNNAIKLGKVKKTPPRHYNTEQCEAIIADILERRAMSKAEWKTQGSGAW